MRSYTNFPYLFLQNVFYSKLDGLLDLHLIFSIQSFVDKHTEEILSYAVSLANDPNDKTQQLVNLIAGVENAQELNELYCDAEVCFANRHDRLDDEVLKDLNANFIKNLDEINKLLEERVLTLEVTRTPSPKVRAEVCSPVERPGLVPVAKWTKEQILDQEACEEVSSDQGSTTDFGSTTSPSVTDCEDIGVQGFYKNDSNESLSSFTTNSSSDVSASNSAADYEDHICHTPPPREEAPSKRQCPGVKRRGLDEVKNWSAAELENPFGGGPGFSVL